MSRVSILCRLSATALVSAGLVATGAITSASLAQIPREDQQCFTPTVADAHGAHGSAAARGGFGPDHREISADEQRAIEVRTQKKLEAQGQSLADATASFAGADVPVYVHVMRSKTGAGDVDRDI